MTLNGDNDDDEAQRTNRDLNEPLLATTNDHDDVDTEAAGGRSKSGITTVTAVETNGEESGGGGGDVSLLPSAADGGDGTTSSSTFSVREEIYEMISLGLPLAISFFCRMGMASTDNAFVGHIRHGTHEPQTYLAAAALSDMVVNVLLVPPLAFNQVLNALVGQAVGSGNPKMAGVWLQQSMFWLVLTMFPCLVGCFYVEPILLSCGFDDDVSHIAGIYAMFNVFWPIPNGLYQCMRFYFQAQGIPRPAMYNNIMFLFINALLNYIFVFGGPFRHMKTFGYWEGFGFIGAAISLSISRTMQGVVYYIYMFLYRQAHIPTWPGLSWEHHTYSRTCEFLKQTVPNIGTLLFQSCVSQATTFLIARLGGRAIAASSALSTVTIPLSGTLSATTWTVSSVRVGYHLGRGHGNDAKHSAWIVLQFITIVTIVISIVFIVFRDKILVIATSDEELIDLGRVLIPAMLVGTYLNLVVGNVTSGVFSGMGRPFIATILSFGLELPLSIGGVALYVLKFHGDLLGVYWLQAAFGGIEAIIVILIMISSNWNQCADEARRRQETSSSSPEHEQNAAVPLDDDDDDDDDDAEGVDDDDDDSDDDDEGAALTTQSDD